MAPNFRGIRLIDGDGNTYAFQCSLDTNSNQIEDILLSTQQGISKLVGYKLVIDGVYKNAEDQILENQAMFNFYKKVELNSEGQNVTQKEFGVAMKEILKTARISKINQAKFTSWKGEPVEHDGRGYFLKRTIKCAVGECSHKINGTIRLSLDTEGSISRGQNFSPDDKNVQRARKGSKGWLCPECAVTTIEIPVETPVVAPEPETPGFELVEEKIKAPKVNKTNKKEKIMKRLADLSDDQSQVSAEYLKGFLSASLEILKDLD